MRIELTLPEPPSANRYWRHAKGRTYLSAEAKEYRWEVALVLARELGVSDTVIFPKGVPVKVTAHWYRSRKAGDLSNRWKQPEDALNGLVWADDAQVIELHLYRHDAPKRGRLELIVENAE